MKIINVFIIFFYFFTTQFSYIDATVNEVTPASNTPIAPTDPVNISSTTPPAIPAISTPAPTATTVTATPITTEMPTVSATPITTEIPTVSATPITTEMPTVSATPITTEIPTVSATPITTEIPTASATAISAIPAPIIPSNQFLTSIYIQNNGAQDALLQQVELSLTDKDSKKSSVIKANLQISIPSAKNIYNRGSIIGFDISTSDDKIHSFNEVTSITISNTQIVLNNNGNGLSASNPIVITQKDGQWTLAI